MAPRPLHAALAARRLGGVVCAVLLVLLTALSAAAQSPMPPLPSVSPPTAEAQHPAATPSVTLTPPGPLVFVPLRIPSSEQAPGQTGTVQGRVVDMRGQPVVGAVVRLWVDQFSVLATTVADGSYVFAGLAPGTYQVAVHDRPSQIATVRFDPGEVVVLNFVQRAAVSGNVAPVPPTPPVPLTPTPTRAVGPASPTPVAAMASVTATPRPTPTLAPLPTPAPIIIALPTALPTSPTRIQPRVTTPVELFVRALPWADLVAPLVWGGLAGIILVGLLALASLRRR